MSYRQLADQVIDLADRLANAGVQAGSGVILALPNGIPFVTSFLALAALRAVAIPISTGTTPDELGRYIDGHVATFILTQHPGNSLYGPACNAKLPPVLLLEDLPAATGLTLGDAYGGPVLCQHSSGSTGQPKRCLRTQRHLLVGSDSLSAATHIGSGDAILCAIPLHHSHGITNCLILALCNGAKLVILEPRQAPGSGKELPLPLRRGELLNMVQRESISIIPGIPFLFSLLADGAPDDVNGHALRLCFSAGSPLSKDIYDRFKTRLGIPLRQLYGSTETGAVTINLAADIDSSWDSVGHPLPGCELLVNNSADGMAEGPVAIRSPAMCSEYLGQPGLSRQYFVDGWFHPGDRARRNEDGDLRLTGRIRPFIVSAGHKIDPAEVEAVLLSHPSVEETVVTGWAHGTVGELVKAFVVTRKNVEVREEELADLCRLRLEPFKVPKSFTFLDRLPRTPLGKLSIDSLTRIQGQP